MKICADIFPWTLSVPQSLHFSSGFVLRKCLLAQSKECLQTNIWTYFCTRLRLLFNIYMYTLSFGRNINLLNWHPTCCILTFYSHHNVTKLINFAFFICICTHSILNTYWPHYVGRQILTVLLTVGGMNLCQVQVTSVSHVGQMPRIHCSCSIQGIQLFTGWEHNYYDYLTADRTKKHLISGHDLLTS